MTQIQDSTGLHTYTATAHRARRLGLRFSERRLMLGAGDVLVINLMLIAALLLRTDLIPNVFALTNLSKWFVTLALFWLCIGTIFEVYDMMHTARISDSLRRAVPAALVTSVIYIATPWFTPSIINRTQAFLFILFACAGVGLWRIVYTRLFYQPTFRRRILVAGNGDKARALERIFSARGSQDWPTHYTLLGCIGDGEDAEVLGKSSQLVEMVRRYGADEVVIALDDSAEMPPELFEAIMDCRELGIPLANMHTFYERISDRVAIEHISQDIELATGYKRESLARLHFTAKRLIDIVGALLSVIALVLMIPIIWLINLFTSPGPLFFRQLRVGRNGKPFTIIKFRTMVPDAEKSSGAIWARKGDSRVTPIGRILRPTHLDELPQIINVLRGDMSLVGPRPERPKFVGQLTRSVPYYRARNSVRPGITGWAQVQQGYTDSVEDAAIKLEYDLYYIKHGSVLLDVLIMLRTVSKVVTFFGR